MNDEFRTTSIQTIVALVLKEMRIERGLHQAQVADALGKTASAVAKIEMGQMTISMDIFYAMCGYYMVSGAQVLNAVERYAQVLMSNANAWYVGRNQAEVDSLAVLAAEYYGCPGFRRRQQSYTPYGGRTVVSGPDYWGEAVSYMPDVFQFALDREFRTRQESPSVI